MSAGAPSSPPALSVVIAVQQAQANLPAILAALDPAASPGLEVLLCHAADDAVEARLADMPGVRLIRGRPDALIPELWRDGIVAARGARLGILSAHCIPDPDWPQAARDLDMTRCAAYGGVIRNAPDADATGTAVHLLRYAGVSEISAPRPARDIAADNAVYDRAAILDCADLLPLGFWEPSYHDRFRARGLKLELTPALRATHANRYSVRAFMRQRRLHGRAFGRARAAAAPAWKRWLMLALSPAAFPVHALKLTRRILKTPALRAGFRRAAPRFYLFMASWSRGEMAGYADAALGRDLSTETLR